MGGEAVLRGSQGVARGVGAQLRARAVGGEVARSVGGAALGLARRDGAAVSVQRLQQVVHATASAARLTETADTAWGEAIVGYGLRIDEIREAAERQLDMRNALAAGALDAQTRLVLDGLSHERRAADARARADAGTAASHYAGVRARLPRARVREPVGVTQSAATIGAGLTPVALRAQAERLAAARDPGLVAQRWAATPERVRRQLVSGETALIGNLEGIPLRDRDAANRIRARAHRAELVQHWRLLELLATAPGAPGVNARERRRVLAEIRSLDAILGTESRGAGRDGCPRPTLVAFDPLRDSLVTYHGALDPRSDGIAASVRRIGVIVPGTNASLGNASAELARAQDLAAESGSGTAYFTWRGGPMPEFSPHGAIAEPAAQSFAEVSSPRLATFVNGLALPPGAELTPIAHSYGAVVLGGAERQGLRADRVVYVAPAGLGRGIRGLQDFPATGGQPHFVLQARNDGVVGWNQGSQLASRLGLGHGRLNPLTAPGIVRLETGYRAADDPGSGRLESEGPIAAHSNPFTAGSTALRNVVAVVEGREVTRFDATSPRWERAMDRAPVARRWASLPPVAGELISSRADGPTP